MKSGSPQIINIEGFHAPYITPPVPDLEKIDGYSLPKSQQKWIRPILPSDEEIATYSDKDKSELVYREFTRRLFGHWFINNGEPVYITGDYYFYLTYWFIGAVTSDGYPEYRKANSEWMYVVDYCEKDNSCMGLIAMCQKRDGKTERHLATLYNRATLIDENCLFGMQSLTATEAKNNLFKSRLMRSHKLIHNYLKPVSNETTSKREIISELTFKGENVGKGKYKAGLNNVIDWRPTLANAYQGKRPKMIFIDEAGSIDEMDLEEWWTTVKQQLVLGKKIFGKAYLPTTLESMTPKGAAKYQKLWDESDPNKIDDNGRTQSGLYRYFKPHYKGREGFIDQYGNDLEEEAIKFRQNELDNATIDNQRKIKRQYPANVDEAFDVDFGGGLDSDAIEILKQRKKEILLNKEVERLAHKIFEYNGEIHTSVSGKAKSGDLVIFEKPKENVKYRIGVDGTGTDKQTSNSSKKKSRYSVSVTKLFDPEPNARSYCDVAELVIEPDRQEDCFRITFLLCKYYNKYDNCKILPEGNIGTAPAIVGYFENRGGLKMMLKQPKYLGTDSKETLNRYCFYRDGTVLETQILLLNQAVRMYGHFINSVDLIDDLIKVGKGNTDMASSYMAAILGWGGFSNPDGAKKQKPKARAWVVVGYNKGVPIYEER
jgi:hypothetical protein